MPADNSARMQTVQLPSRPAPVLIADLEHAGALTATQAVWLSEHWYHLPDDWASNPYLRSVAEHSRACIDRECGRRVATINPQPKEHIHA